MHGSALSQMKYTEAEQMIAKMPKKSREFLEAECVKIANGQIAGRGTQRVTIKRLSLKGTGPNWDVDEIQPQLPTIADKEVRDAIKKLSSRFVLGGS